MTPSYGSDTVLQYSGLRRLTLVESGAQIEVRGPGKSWIASHQVRYDQIVAVYRYEMRDWGYAVVLSLVWFGAFILLSIVSLLMQDPGYFFLIGALVISVGVLLLGAYRILSAPKRLLRIDIVGQPPMIVPNSNPGFFYALASRLPKSEPVPPAAPSTSVPFAGEAPAWEAPDPSPVEGVSPVSRDEEA